MDSEGVFVTVLLAIAILGLCFMAHACNTNSKRYIDAGYTKQVRCSQMTEMWVKNG